jgi:hypothetical protein
MEGKDFPCPLLRGCGLLKEQRFFSQGSYCIKTLLLALTRPPEISQDSLSRISLIRCKMFASRVSIHPDESVDELLSSTPFAVLREMPPNSVKPQALYFLSSMGWHALTF